MKFLFRFSYIQIQLRKFVVLTFLVLISTNAAAANRTMAIKESTYKEMQKAQLLIDEQKFKHASEILYELLEKKLNHYEIAQTHSILGGLYYQQENYDRAYNSFTNVIAYKDIPDGLYQLALKTLAQLALATDRHLEAQNHIKELLSLVAEPNAQLYILLAQSYLSAEKYQQALIPLTKALDLQRSSGEKIHENWLLMANSIYYSLEMFEEMKEVLIELAENHTKTQYLLNLAAVYGQLGDTKQQLLILEPLYEKGEIVQESLLLNLANLYMLHGVPVKSAHLLSMSINNGKIRASKPNFEMLAQSWKMSRDTAKAITALKRASELSEDGSTNLHIAQLYFYLYDWQGAEKELKTALRKGGIENPGNANLLLGMSQFNQKRYSDAILSLQKAEQHGETGDLAKQWIAYVRSEWNKEKELENL